MIEIRKLSDGLRPACGIGMFGFYPWEGRVATPFGAAWGRVEAGEATVGHGHHEAETFIIVSGRGRVEVAGEKREVEAGDVLYFPPFTRHTLRNGEAEPALDFITLWWEDPHLALAGGASPAREEGTRRPVVAVPAPPTPNGDLHLGHLAGPYLAADVYVRYLRLRGEPAFLQLSTDDYQSWVKRRADDEERSPEEVARSCSARMQATLEAFDIRPDVVLEPLASPGYAEDIQRYFLGLVHDGVLVRRRTPILHCSACERELHEPWVRGRCPHCGMPCCGNGCEECGQPNVCTDLHEARCALCGASPTIREVERFVLPLEASRDALAEHASRAHMSAHLRATVERMLVDGLPELPVTQVCDWGIPVPVPGFEGQVIWPWFEMARGIKLTLEKLARAEGWDVDDAGVPRVRPRLVTFFGFDNGYYFNVLMPALYTAAGDWNPLGTTVGNELYQLQGEKFSTSRSHAVWGADFAAEVPSDHARFYLCWDRPETRPTSFEREEFDRVVQHELQEVWGGWLTDLAARVSERFDGVAPEPGFWAGPHRAFWELLDRTLVELAAAYEAESFSLRRAVRRLSGLVRETREFAVDQRHAAAVDSLRAEERTAVALELAAARLLATAAAPVTPRLSARLWRCLGLSGTVEEAGWPRHPEWVPAGSRVTLEGCAERESPRQASRTEQTQRTPADSAPSDPPGGRTARGSNPTETRP